MPDVGEPSRAAMPPAERAVAQRAARLASGWGTHHEGVEEPEGIERPERGLKEGCFSFSGGARGGAVPTRSLIKFRNRSDEAGPGRRGEAGDNGAYFYNAPISNFAEFCILLCCKSKTRSHLEGDT